LLLKKTPKSLRCVCVEKLTCVLDVFCF
jgi:hypothetical protein